MIWQDIGVGGERFGGHVVERREIQDGGSTNYLLYKMDFRGSKVIVLDSSPDVVRAIYGLDELLKPPASVSPFLPFPLQSMA